jgi:hypothetical protein
MPITDAGHRARRGYRCADEAATREGETRGSSTPGAAVRAMPAGLSLRCLLFRSSWLTMGAAARLLHLRSGGTAVGVQAAWLVRFQASSLDGSNLATQRCWL